MTLGQRTNAIYQHVISSAMDLKIDLLARAGQCVAWCGARVDPAWVLLAAFMMRLGTFTKLGVIATVFAWTVVVLASRMTATRRSVVFLPPSWVVSVLFPLVGLPMGEASDLSGGGLLVMALGMLVHWPLIGWLLDRLVVTAHRRSGAQSRGDGCNRRVKHIWRSPRRSASCAHATTQGDGRATGAA